MHRHLEDEGVVSRLCSGILVYSTPTSEPRPVKYNAGTGSRMLRKQVLNGRDGKVRKQLIFSEKLDVEGVIYISTY